MMKVPEQYAVPPMPETKRPRKFALEYIAGAHVARFYNGSYMRMYPDRVDFYTPQSQLVWTYNVEPEVPQCGIYLEPLQPSHNVIRDMCARMRRRRK